jgi:hypothetical protein
MLVGIDFDNTIVCYDQSFHRAALEKDLIPMQVPAVKSQLRDYLRRQGQEEEWILLQGLVYGQRILEGVPFPGVLEFLTRCGQHGVDVCIISHRTRKAERGYPYDLHEAALCWLDNHGFNDKSGLGKVVQSSHFELTRQQKLSRIGLSGCSYFIDDLPEFLGSPSFPPQVQRILFDPEGQSEPADCVRAANSWEQIGEFIFGDKHS